MVKQYMQKKYVLWQCSVKPRAFITSLFPDVKVGELKDWNYLPQINFHVCSSVGIRKTAEKRKKYTLILAVVFVCQEKNHH